MKTRTLVQKLMSTKLWLAAAGLFAGVYLALGGDADDISTVAGAVTSLVSLVTYIVTEGRIDAAAVGRAAGSVQAAVDTIAAEGEEDGN